MNRKQMMDKDSSLVE